MWYLSDFFDIHIFIPLLEKFNAEYIENLTYSRALQILQNISKANEIENARSWHYQEKSKKENELKKDGHKIVNFDEALEDYFEKKVDPVSNSIGNLIRFAPEGDSKNELE